MSVAVVVLDTLRADAFERHFDWLPGRRFENAWSPSHWTVPVHGALFTGRYPSETGVHAKNVPLDWDNRVLAERLADAGYTTRAFSSNPYVSPVFDFDRGFEAFTGSWRLRQLDPDLFDWTGFVSETSDQGPSRYLRALSRCVRGDCRTLPSLRQGLRMKLREWNYVDSIDDDGAAGAVEFARTTEFGSEEFLYINLMEAHTPYDPPEAYETVELTHGPGLAETIGAGTDTTTDVETVEQAYDDCVRYLSDRYEELFDALTGAFDYVVTLSDHGELFGEHGAWMHGYGLYPELTNVPLSVYGPDIEDGRTDEFVSLLDVHATVLDIALDAGEDSRGRSLLGDGSRETCLTEYHGFTRQKLNTLRNADVSSDRIEHHDRTFRGLVRPGYYGYETPEEFVATGSGIENGEAALQRRVEELDTTERADDSQELSEDVLTHLEDLGYA